MSRRFLELAALASVACALAPAASAARKPAVHHGAQFGIVAVGKWPKGWFVLDSRPGTRLHAELLVTNRGDAKGSVRLTGVDATTGRTSGAVYLDPDAHQRGVGRWIDLDRRELTLAPGQSVRVPFAVAVPSDTSAGEHLGGLVVEPLHLATPAPRAGKAGGLGIRVRQLSIVAVQVDVPGPRVEKVSVGSAEASRSNGYQWVSVRLANDGNVMIKPHGTLLVADTHGRRVAAARFALDTFVPGTSIPYPVLVRGKEIPAGTYRASIDVWAAAGRHVHATVPLVVADDDTIATYGSPKPHFGSPAAAATPRSHPVAPAPRLREDGGDTHRFPLPALLVILLLAALASATLLLRRRLRPVALAAAATAPPAPAPAPPPAPAAKPKAKANQPQRSRKSRAQRRKKRR